MTLKELIMTGPEGLSPYRVTYFGVTATLDEKLFSSMSNMEVKGWDISKTDETPTGFYIDIEMEDEIC